MNGPGLLDRSLWAACWAACILLALGASARGADQAGAGAGPSPNPAQAMYVLTLGKALPGEKPLTIHLDCEAGKFTAGMGTGLNKRAHDVDFSGLKLEGNRIQGSVKVTVIPDPWLPADGKPIACAYTLDATVADGAVTGTHKGTCGAAACEGAVAGQAVTRPDARTCRIRLDLAGALLRLYQARGSNWKYALDMALILPFRDGQLFQPKFESVVPDYRGYSAVVTKHELRLEGHALTGTLEIDVDYGGQGRGAEYPAGEKHFYTLNGLVFGNVVGGTYDVKVGDLAAQGCRFIGSLNAGPPPAPARSLCQFRLHGAMKEGPVVLHLCLNENAPIHGNALAPRYNHEVHAVDATGLKLDGDRLRGTVRVIIAPDCYRPVESITLEYELDVKVDGQEITGTFSGKDRGKEYQGSITGETWAKSSPEPLVTLANLAECELNLRNPVGVSKLAKLRFKDGKLEAGEVTVQEKSAPPPVKVERAEINIQRDRLTGTVAFTHPTEGPKAVQYVYTFEAIVDGEKVSGFWRATANGKPLLTKSAKMYGKVSAAR